MGTAVPKVLIYKAMVLYSKYKALRIIWNCSETILHGSLVFLHILQLRQWLSFVPDYLLRTFTEQTTSKNSVSLQIQGQACLLSILKDLGSLNLRFHSYNESHCNAGIIWTSTSCGNCDKKMLLFYVIACLLLTWEFYVFYQYPWSRLTC